MVLVLVVVLTVVSRLHCCLDIEMIRATYVHFRANRDHCHSELSSTILSSTSFYTLVLNWNNTALLYFTCNFNYIYYILQNIPTIKIECPVNN